MTAQKDQAPLVPVDQLDHYTLIVPNAKQVSDFHEHVLGYRLINRILVNAGTAPDGAHDMLNFVLGWPGSDHGVMVVTEGLTEQSIFHRFMMQYGQGIHHLAFEVDDIQGAFNLLRREGIELTSDHILRDPLTGLKQFFIASRYVGVFIELIERKADTADSQNEEQGFFTHDNMGGLARTMQGYVGGNCDERAAGGDLDQTTYYAGAAAIEGVRLGNLYITPPDFQVAADFLRQVLGFSQYSTAFYAGGDPSKAIVLLPRKDGNEGGVLPARFAMTVDDLEKAENRLKQAVRNYSCGNGHVSPPLVASGYPIDLEHS